MSEFDNSNVYSTDHPLGRYPSLRKQRLETGCWIDGHWGQYGVTRLIEIAQDHGFVIDDNDEAAVKAYRDGTDLFTDEATGLSHSATDWILMQGGLADDAEEWLNENIADEGFSFGWSDSEFFYMNNEWFEND